MLRNFMVGVGMLGTLPFFNRLTTYADVGNSFSDGGDGGGGGLYGLIFYFLLSTPIGRVILIGFVIAVVVSIWLDQKKEKQITKTIQLEDPQFELKAFEEEVRTVFLKVQEAWEKLDWSTVRSFESNELFARHSTQLQEYIEKGWQPHLDDQHISDVLLVDFTKDGRYDYLTVKLTASLLDYTTSASGQVIDGSDTKRKVRTYKLIFKRVSGVQTQTQYGNNTTNCPNCGAPSDVSSSGECEYCGSIITSGEYGWVLDDYGVFHGA